MRDLLQEMREGKPLSLRLQLLLIIQLSIPAILAQISQIMMEYIDSSMVGHLGAAASASIGLVASTTWFFGGLTRAIGVGFYVQVAHRIGAGDERHARDLVKQGVIVSAVLGILLGLVGVAISGSLPVWLGGTPEIIADAQKYFLIFAFTIPIYSLEFVATGLLQCAGNMTAPSAIHVIMCFLDVLFNYILIYHFNMGVAGAAAGTLLSAMFAAVVMLYLVLVKSDVLHLRREESVKSGHGLRSYHGMWDMMDLQRAVKIAVPVAMESVALSLSQIISTTIVAPLGTIAIAANSLAVTAESLCYMPGYGIGSAATTMIGQAIGAERGTMVRRLGWIVTAFGMAIMAGTGALMFVFAPQMIGLLTPDPAVRELGAMVLRIEAFAEPMYAASIVANGVFRGAGDTLVPSILNFVSMWIIRLPLAWYLAPRIGLRGVWIAMAIELSARGLMFLIRLAGRRWQRKLV